MKKENIISGIILFIALQFLISALVWRVIDLNDRVTKLEQKEQK